MNDLSNYRKSYDKNELLESTIPTNPMELFDLWFREVEDAGGEFEVNAMTVATIGKDGFPKSRVVLLKQVTQEGFVFYTNYNSDKGQAIISNPQVCLSFFWPNLERQVIIKGTAIKTSPEVSDAYFNSRPLGSRLGAIVSNQSDIIPGRSFLEDALQELEKEMIDKEVKRPEHWGGFIVSPVEIEFWQGRPNRLHDRIRFESTQTGKWETSRLAP
ncbi:pyridoxamine 5'-phosphate oxidase [Flavobacterium turcicum]|uniref:Pyridoxine/pyridoxamine 5'-phosphate oxidase n=1 Tax=Flavobacterium turcicum TaxID=2764718 RepID=A0ABR7JHW8_9FLAO|nr:pyridoxamine 5'-phosphate oxidase [Flavobacterium turcicum]MBC5864079.1 pyridoxamine 5'-phosphate oxidase [Flavobacterium turcicum]NHL02845.1 pyridoxamine 5'-phosphate oxidase [Flavobacterium turcicum]